MDKYWQLSILNQVSAKENKVSDQSKFHKSQKEVSDIMRSLRLSTHRVEELIDELYGKNKRLAYLEDSSTNPIL